KRELKIEQKLMEQEEKRQEKILAQKKRKKERKKFVSRLKRNLMIFSVFMSVCGLLIYSDQSNREMFLGRKILKDTHNKSVISADKLKESLQNLLGKLWYGSGSESDLDIDQEIENPDSVTVASFNIRIFSDNSRDDKELNVIADILKKYDVIAVQEVRDEQVVKRTLEILKKKGLVYGYMISDAVGRGVKEKYVFLFRKNKVSVIKQGKIYKDEGDKFIREPFYATFKSGNFDFTLATIHVLFGNNESERRPEIVQLSDVYKKIQAEDEGEQDVIVLGDFNFSPLDTGFYSLKSFPSMLYLISPPLKTTVSDTSLYDNFWFQRSFLKEYTGKFGVDSFDKKIFMGKTAIAKKAVSDHRPIWAEFAIKGEDDD
ncbi:endonuclease/exonuclease/phosphatase family protein, partial [bacterium]|nr:endonuclease/exonuclease/phosphatase family protein [bacterium]